MSSLAAAKADNFYYPPDFDPKKHQTLNKYNGQHPLRERAAKLDQGILVIRFEIPFNIWCAKCGEHIAKGERFNAEKKAIGNYFSTKVLQFTMSHHCGCKITIQTDPKNTEYLVVEGARKKEESYSAADAEVIELPDEAEREHRQRDHFYRLEYQQGAKAKALSEAERLAAIHDAVDAHSKDPYTLNRAARAALRGEKRAAAAADAERSALGLPEHVALLPEAGGDRLAAQVAFLTSFARAESGAEARRKRILEQDIFGGPAGLGGSDAAAAAAGPAVGGGGGGSGRSLTGMKSQTKRQATALPAVRVVVRPGAADAAGFGPQPPQDGLVEGGSSQGAMPSCRQGMAATPAVGGCGSGINCSAPRDGGPALGRGGGCGGSCTLPSPPVAIATASAVAVAAAASAPTGRPPPGAAALAAAAAARAAATRGGNGAKAMAGFSTASSAIGTGSSLKRSNKDRAAELQKRRAGPAGAGLVAARPVL